MKTNEARGGRRWPPAVDRGAEEEGDLRQGSRPKAGEEKPPRRLDSAPLPMLAGPMEKVESAAPVSAPRDIDALVNEITISLRGPGPGEVEIQFDSKTSPRVEVRISKENNRLQVRLHTDSPEVTQLMTRADGRARAAARGEGIYGSGGAGQEAAGRPAGTAARAAEMIRMTARRSEIPLWNWHAAAFPTVATGAPG